MKRGLMCFPKIYVEEKIFTKLIFKKINNFPGFLYFHRYFPVPVGEMKKSQINCKTFVHITHSYFFQFPSKNDQN